MSLSVLSLRTQMLAALEGCAPAGVFDDEALHCIESTCDVQCYVNDGFLVARRGDIEARIALTGHDVVPLEEEDGEEDLEYIGVDDDRG